MKYAKKMVLVDINTIKPNSATSAHVEDKVVNNLTKAISSLASSNEFSRSHFGDSATAISHLYNEMNKILEREDLKPDVKLKLYHEKLKRYLFLQRTSEEKGSYEEIISSQSQPPLSQSELDFNQVPEIPQTPVKPPFPLITPRVKRLHHTKLPRTTPKELILRDPSLIQPPKHYDKYLYTGGQLLREVKNLRGGGEDVNYKMNKSEKKLSAIYYAADHPASFSNVNKLWLATSKKIPKKTITEWLLKQDTYTRHKPKRIHFPRNCYIINNMDQLWEIDLIVFPPNFAEHNNDIKYILCNFVLHFNFNIFL